jgi:hypothetical protein
MIAAEVKGRDPKITCEIVDIYTATKEDMAVLRKIGTLDQIYGNNYEASYHLR